MVCLSQARYDTTQPSQAGDIVWRARLPPRRPEGADAILIMGSSMAENRTKDSVVIEKRENRGEGYSRRSSYAEPWRSGYRGRAATCFYWVG
jgi:hypothetical protein